MTLVAVSIYYYVLMLQVRMSVCRHLGLICTFGISQEVSYVSLNDDQSNL